MMLRTSFAAAAVLAAVSLPGATAAQTPAPAASGPGVPHYWQTRAERSGYRQTADYEETFQTTTDPDYQSIHDWIMAGVTP
jgi:hypothetical protein